MRKATEVAGLIEAKRNPKGPLLPEIEAVAARSRRAEAAARQRPRRQRECNIRRRAVRFADSVKSQGISCRRAARGLCMPPRTLCDWCWREQGKEASCHPRGRPCKESPLPERLGVLEFLRDTGPGTGLPALRAAFPTMARCELADLRRFYWEVYRDANCVAIEQLIWRSPGRVWAMDHAEPPSPVDGSYPALLSVRDLASGMVLAWLPVMDQTAATTRDVVEELFIQFGAPLVLKSDNGSAFKAEVAELLAEWRVIGLPSPPRTPRYNGSCEAGIGGLKLRTTEQAARAGHPGIWTSEDTEAARRRSNEFHYPDGHNRPTPLETWQRRTPIQSFERRRLRLTIQTRRCQIHGSLELASGGTVTAARRAANHRRVVRQALVELGILSTSWRLITLPLKPKKWAKIL